MKVTKSNLPHNSVLNDTQIQYDYVDSFEGELIDADNKYTSLDIGKAFFKSSPQWVSKLFSLRNRIVSIFGLKTAGANKSADEVLKNFKCEKGEQLGLFKVYVRTENEVILGEDDKHLDFKVSLFLQPDNEAENKKKLTVSTIVVFHNWFGRLYFMPVRFFHKLIVPAMLKAIIVELEKPT